MIILAVSILNRLPTEYKGVVELHLGGLAAGIREIYIVIRLFPFLGKMVHNVEDGQAEIGLSGTIGTIDDAILNDVILNGIRAEIIVAMPCQVQLYFISKTPEIFYGKLCEHNQNNLIFSAKII